LYLTTEMVVPCRGAGGEPPVKGAPPEGARLEKPAGRPSFWGEMFGRGGFCVASERVDSRARRLRVFEEAVHAA